MKIEEAKLIPLQTLIENLGGTFSHMDRQNNLWFLSPFRPEENTASFKVNTKLNTWHDFGLSKTFAHQNQGSGGDIIDLWCDYHFKDRRQGIPEALQALENLMGEIAPNSQKLVTNNIYKPHVATNSPRFKIIKILDEITFRGLKDELIRRRISLKVANLYLKQGHVLDTILNKTYTAFLFENDKGGYEVSIPNPVKKSSFKTCIGPKASARILTSSNETNKADVFEGFWDFLSWLEFNGRQLPNHHSYILNTTSLTQEVADKIYGFKDIVDEVFLFMDNDEAGYQAMHNLAATLGDFNFNVATLEQVYKGYNDLSEFWTESPNAKPKV